MGVWESDCEAQAEALAEQGEAADTGAADAHPEYDGIGPWDDRVDTYDGIGSWDDRVDHRGIPTRRLRVVRGNTMQSDGRVPADVHAFVSVALESR